MTEQRPIGPPAIPAGASDWKVALMVQHFPVISETFVATLAASLLQHVSDLRLLVTSGEIAPPPHQPVVAAAGLLERVALARRDGRIPVGRMVELGRHHPGKRARLLGLGALDLVAPRPKLALTRMLVRQPDFDIVHCQFGYEGLTALRHRRYGTLRTRALVVHLRGSDITRFVRMHGPEIYADLFREAELFIANCEHFRQTAIGHGCDPGKIVVVGSPIDTERFGPPATARPRPDGRPLRLVAVGRLVAKKGFGDLIEAAGRLGDLDFRLDILGEGPLRSEFERRIAELGLGDRVALHGAVTSDRVLDALHAADIALAPSVTAETGDADAPVNTLKEAMATGLPVIATRHGGIPELVIPLGQDGENGLLVPERDPGALAGAIRDLSARPDIWPRLGAAGRAKVVEDYGLSRVAEKTLAAYSMALDR